MSDKFDNANDKFGKKSIPEGFKMPPVPTPEPVKTGKYASFMGEGWTKIDHELEGKWVSPRDAKGQLMHTSVDFVEEAYKHNETGEIFGITNGGKGGVQLQHAVELTDDVVDRFYSPEHLPEEIRGQYSHVFKSQEEKRRKNQELSRQRKEEGIEHIKKYLDIKPESSVDDLYRYIGRKGFGTDVPMADVNQIHKDFNASKESIPEDVQKKIDNKNNPPTEELKEVVKSKSSTESTPYEILDKDGHVIGNGGDSHGRGGGGSHGGGGDGPHIPPGGGGPHGPHIPPIEEDTKFMKAAMKFGKFASNEKVLGIGAMISKFGYMQMTNPLIFTAVEAGHGVLEAGLMLAITGKKDTPSQFVGDMVGAMGLGYVLHKGAELGFQGLARSEYGSNLAGKAVDGIIKGISNGAISPVEGEITVGKLVAHSMRTFIKPIDFGLLKTFGAAGAAAGLLYSMINNKKDGFWGTAGNIASGAGLAMLGREVYGHISKSREHKLEHENAPKKLTPGEAIKENVAKIKKTDAGYLGFEAVDEILKTDAGQQIQKTLGSILDTTNEGKYLKSLYSSIMSGDMEGIVNVISNHDEILKNVEGFRKHVQDYIATPGGRRNYIKFAQQAADSLEHYGPDIREALKTDVNKAIEEHISKISDVTKDVQKVYTDNHGFIRTALSKMGFSDKDLDVLHEGMTTGLTKATKELDDITNKEVGDGPKSGDAAEGTIKTVGDLTEHDVKEKSIKNLKSEKKMTEWKEKGKMLGAIGLGVFAVGTAIDISDRMDHKSKTSEMVNSEQQMKNKKQSKAEKKYHQQAYGAVNMGDMVTQMFQERIGHHKMGNSKFGPNQYTIQGQTYNI